MRKIFALWETIRIKIRRKYIKLTSKKRRKKILTNDFTIISNNCWGGFIYQSYGIQYNTPTIGCFFIASDYIKFISNLRYYLSQDLKFINPSDSKWFNKVNKTHNYGNYPIGIIDDVEVFFMHYTSKEEAYNKWNKRKKRVNYKKIIYKFSEMNECSDEDIENFQKLELKNKICFISKNKEKYKNSYTFVINSNNVLASYEPFGKNKYFDMNKILNEVGEE